MKKYMILIFTFLVCSVGRAEDQYVFRIKWPEKTLIADFGPTNGLAPFFSADRRRLSIIVTKDQYDAGYTNLSHSVVSNAIDIADGIEAGMTDDARLKAIIEGLVVCINKRIPSDKITAAELKAAIIEGMKGEQEND